MLKQLVRYGSSLVFVWHASERKLYDLKEGDVFELSMKKKDPKTLQKNKLKE